MEKIKISDGLCTYLESLNYEVNAIRDLIERMKFEDNEKVNNFWLNKYVEIYTEYELAKKELEKEYIIPNYGNNVQWYLDFKTGEISNIVERACIHESNH